MTTLDIFANNIIGNSPTVTRSVRDFTGTNGDRWIKINSPSVPGSFANFFIVKKLSPIDSQAVSSAIDSTSGTNSKIAFDNGGNVTVQGSYVQNPLDSGPTVVGGDDRKQFSDPNKLNYCPYKNIILSTNLKWILYRDTSDANQMYILYNPMHRINIKNYYNSVSANNAFGDDNGFMKTLMENYSNVLTISPINDANKTRAVFADPTCACFELHNCNNDYAGFYISDRSSKTLGWACACGGAQSCVYSKTYSGDSFVQDLKPNLVKALGGNELCPKSVSFCDMNFTSAGNINATDSNIQQNCSGGTNNIPTEAPTTRPQTQAPQTQPSQTQTQPPQTQTQPPQTLAPQAPSASKLSSPLVIGGGISILVLILVGIVVFKFSSLNK